MKVFAVKYSALAGSALLLLATLPAAAKSLEEVTVTALRIPVAASDIIGNHASVDGETMELTGPTHIQQALARVPGVNLQHNSGQEYLPAIRSPVLTGAGACGSFLMAEDGIPLRPAGFCNVNELFEAHSEQAARLEVIRGPGVTLYGSNALHGVVNVITPTPSSEGSRIGVEAGSEDFYRVRVKTGTDNLSLAFTGTTEGSFRDEAGVDQQKLTLGSRHDLDGVLLTTGLTAINLNQETAGYIAGSGAYKNNALAKTNANKEAYRDAEAARIWARFQDKAEQPNWVITPYARTSDMRFLMHFLPGAPTEENGQDSLGVQTAFYHYAGNSRLTAGVDGEIVDGWLKQFQNSPTQGTAFLRETIPVGYHYDYSVAAIQLAPFVQWDHQLAADWDLSLGARYEWMQYDYDNRMLDGRTRDDGTPCSLGGCRYSRPADSTDNFTNISPKLSLGYTLAEDQRLYLTLARGFRAPQAVELYRLQRAQVVADLESERLDSLELGYQFDGDKLDLEIAAYAMQKRNLIFRDSDFFNVDSGRTAHQGIELALAYQLTDALAVSFAATEARHDYDYDELLSGDNINGHAVDGAPRHFGNLVLKWSPLGNTDVELEWLHMGSYYTDPENEHRYGGHDLLNLFSRIQLTPALSINGRVTNLLDREYADRADYTSFDGDRYIPGSPRAVFFGVDYRWD